MAILFLILISFANASQTSELFVIERSTNKNQLHYTLDKEQQLEPYWLMLENNGEREELSLLERKYAYGASLRERIGNSIVYSLAALPNYLITVHGVKESPYATIQVMGSPRILKKVFLQVSSGLFPTVKSIRLDCTSIDRQKRETFILEAQKNGTWREQQVTDFF